MATFKVNGKTYSGFSSSNISILNGKVYVDGKLITDESDSKTVKVIFEGNVGELTVDGDLELHGDAGNIKCTGSVTCQDVEGSVSAGGSVNCADVGENVRAGGSVNAHDVDGSVTAGGSVNHS